MIYILSTAQNIFVIPYNNKKTSSGFYLNNLETLTQSKEEGSEIWLSLEGILNSTATQTKFG